MSEAIKIPLGEGAHKSFDSLDAFEKWYAGERAFWSQLESASRSSPSVLWNHLRQNGFQSIAQQLHEAKQGDERRRKAATDSIVAFCKNVYEQQGLFTSASPNAKFIAQLTEKSGGVVAAFATAYLLGMDTSYDGHDQITGMFEGFCFQQGLKKRGPAEEAALAQLRVNWDSEFQSVKETQKAEVGALRQQIADREGEITELKNQFNAFFKQSKTDWTEKLSLYEEKLALAAPVTYWTRKGWWHLGGSIGFGIATFVAGYVAFKELRLLASAVLTKPQGAPDSWHPEYWQTATLLIGAAFAIWILRILVKLLLSQIHLRSDSSERVTMVTTYLALLEAKKVTDEDRKLIIAALFRPAATGVVKDEGMPIPSLEFLTRSGKG